MALWSLSISDLRRRIERVYLRITGQESVMAEDRLIITDGINRAIIDLSTDRGFDELKFIMSDTTVSTVSNQNWVDLDSGVIGVISGTLRIKNERRILTRINLQMFTASDIEEVGSGTPGFYALDQGASAGLLRLRLRPIPDAVYTIDLKVQTIPDEDSISTIPGWMHHVLQSLATSISLEALGMPVEAIPFQNSYERSVKNVREQQRGDSGPQHVQTRTADARGSDIQARANV